MIVASIPPMPKNSQPRRVKIFNPMLKPVIDSNFHGANNTTRPNNWGYDCHVTESLICISLHFTVCHIELLCNVIWYKIYMYKFNIDFHVCVCVCWSIPRPLWHVRVFSRTIKWSIHRWSSPKKYHAHPNLPHNMQVCTMQLGFEDISGRPRILWTSFRWEW